MFVEVKIKVWNSKAKDEKDRERYLIKSGDIVYGKIRKMEEKDGKAWIVCNSKWC